MDQASRPSSCWLMLILHLDVKCNALSAPFHCDRPFPSRISFRPQKTRSIKTLVPLPADSVSRLRTKSTSCRACVTKPTNRLHVMAFQLVPVAALRKASGRSYHHCLTRGCRDAWLVLPRVH
ncbi:hypothetical protein F5X68DRAFT_16994 [Plectosphaerella plurivora]|uniref:Secreted protein n=1 Tax=Plectosphaerella plurivora TaxID=936078 RepID=A0A9P8V9J7_9PEZI|nr:hypothetical protein F5X68DRAFT_16994 [Plectosphaerella plurivora]